MCNFLDANLIWVAPERRDVGGLACLYHIAFGRKCNLSEALKECMKKKMLGMGVSWLIYIPRVDLRHVVGLLELLHQRTKVTHSF
jgi:hypothetical protein